MRTHRRRQQFRKRQFYILRQRVDRTIREIISSPRHDPYYRQMLGFAAA